MASSDKIEPGSPATPKKGTPVARGLFGRPKPAKAAGDK